ncbi:Crp/Fnr family transcriptional regulator [Paenimyroides aestuarii]|uniref:Crp/Fnr family transcriptional regulator n=1 Tax=Paenimyroides aestuarii TaxID=2968490 RepID=A0ABY5NP34_9FLAO|nr:Crp/Fnr family transcriptional regulator [Paenimyroides aestuarii]UUV20296.1 Crp/Fnr family transcriptional regulator [Paenimyroides aestuarii]
MLLHVIQKCYHNEHLTAADYETILKKHHLVDFEKGSFLLEQAQTLNCYYILLEGAVHSFVHDSNGNPITINLYTEGEVVIDVNALFQKKKTLENWQCATNCTMLCIMFDDFQELFHAIYGFREWGRAWMANALFELKERSMEMLTLSAKQRYDKLLQQKPQLFQLIPLKHIASYLGVTDTSLSRIRKEYKT